VRCPRPLAVFLLPMTPLFAVNYCCPLLLLLLCNMLHIALPLVVRLLPITAPTVCCCIARCHHTRR
jgi:hypothetical protein